MSEAKFTPGPWTWGEHYRGLYGSGEYNEVLAYAHYEGMWISSLDSTEREKANAALIGAAPDMYEALQMSIADGACYCDQLASVGCKNNVCAHCNAVRAIAKATL